MMLQYVIEFMILHDTIGVFASWPLRDPTAIDRARVGPLLGATRHQTTEPDIYIYVL